MKEIQSCWTLFHYRPTLRHWRVMNESSEFNRQHDLIKLLDD
jgi:hypothetical protein